MAFFRNPLSRPANPPSHRVDPTPAPPPRGATAGQHLVERLRAIVAETTAPEDALEPALRAILDETKTPAGAVCLYDAHHHVLRLVAEVGLSDEGCRSLRNVSGDLSSTWTMPLQSLLSRRAYLIESASENRYVPPLVDDAKAMRTIACLPLYSGSNPVGSLIIIAVKPAVFPEPYIQTLEQPQRELVAIIEAVRSRAAQARIPGSKHHQPAAGAGAGSGFPSARGRTPPPAAEMGEEQKPAAAAQQPAGTDHEASEIRLLRGQPAEPKAAPEARGQESLTAPRRKQDELAAEIEHLRARLTEMESAAAARELESRQEQAAEVEHLLSLLNDAREVTAEAQRLNEELKTSLLLERTRTAEALEQAAVARAHAAEQAARVERLQARLAETEAAAGAREEALTNQLQRKQNERAGDLEATAAREREVHEELAAALERERSRVTALQTEAATSQRDHGAEVQRLNELLAEAETARTLGAARIEELKQAHAELVSKLEAAATREGALRSESDTLKHLANERSAELMEVQEHASAVEHAVVEARAEAAAMRDALAKANARIDELSRTVANTEATAAQIEARASEAENHCTQLERDLDAVQARLREAEGRLTESEQKRPSPAEKGSTPTLARTGEIEVVAPEHPSELRISNAKTRDTPHRHTAVGSAAATPPKTHTQIKPSVQPDQSGPTRFLIIDSEECWSGVAVDGCQVAVVSPAGDLALPAGNTCREPILVNLAVPGMLGVLASFRAAGLTTRFCAYIATPGTGRALKLGMIEATKSPMDPEAVLAALEGYLAPGTRLLTAGREPEAFMSLRQALSRQGVSVSMAWDSNQAQDLLGIIRPEVAVIDLDLPPRDGYGLVAGLADLNPVPTAVLISKGADGAARFATESADRSRASRLVTLHQLLGDLLEPSLTSRPTGRRGDGRHSGAKST